MGSIGSRASESCWGEGEHPPAAQRINESAAASRRETARWLGEFQQNHQQVAAISPPCVDMWLCIQYACLSCLCMPLYMTGEHAGGVQSGLKPFSGPFSQGPDNRLLGCPGFMSQNRKQLQPASLRSAPHKPQRTMLSHSLSWGWTTHGKGGVAFSIFIFFMLQRKKTFVLECCAHSCLLLWNPETTAFTPALSLLCAKAQVLHKPWAGPEGNHRFVPPSPPPAGCFFSMETGASVNWDLVNDLIGWFASPFLCMRHNADGPARKEKGRSKKQIEGKKQEKWFRGKEMEGLKSAKEDGGK